jgi:hypothetical protein
MEGRAMPASYSKSGQVEQRGRLLAAIPQGRKDIHGDYREEFRVALDEYEGHAYIALRVFERGNDGRFYPVKLLFYSCASAFDVTPFVMDREPNPSLLPSATPLR